MSQWGLLHMNIGEHNSIHIRRLGGGSFQNEEETVSKAAEKLREIIVVRGLWQQKVTVPLARVF